MIKAIGANAHLADGPAYYRPMQLALALLMIALPQRLKHELARRVLGWDVDPSAYIGRSLLLVGHVSMAPGASIGHRNVFRELDEVRLAARASIGTRNWVVGIPPNAEMFPASPNRRPSLVMGEGAMLTEAHMIDCADRVELGDYASLAGFRSQVLTHSLNLVRDRFEAHPVTIGDRSAVMSGCILQSGTRVPERCIVSAGSVVNSKLAKPLTFYRGNPAEAVRELPPTLGFFQRGLTHAS
jgi:acetyltransferase-like isoleucine patch superfamily enzyme